ncbi:response regulator transcription factor [Natronincola ferrireducens]|uniref:Stage 0 sporulation protein A homolog n=1 Tax=Natronincola ferrireducens TaxID=393762 RepID=A0A1G8XJK7_9FIRM|nr:helix-turn-helix domain-containing protein [Natronincola ferrireducens]SDJ90802.1 Helix-turn-helix domain-containing protein [Natronincola ferrireducens]
MDDEELSRELLRYLINKYRFPIKVIGQAAAGDEAVGLIFDLKPDIVFLDIEMPGYNGIQVMERINRDYIGAIKFIVITAYNYFEYAQAALRLGAKDILLKPIEPKQFKETIERVLHYNYTDNQFFNEILAYINNNYYKTIQLKETAKRFHTSPNYITRMFKKYFGVSFIVYLNRIKIEKAKELLTDTQLSIKEIANTVGYNNLNYFYKNFKMITGITPKGFKKNEG